jgi:hypothetical protein
LKFIGISLHVPEHNVGVSQEVKKAADKVARNAEPMAQKATDAVLEQTDKVSTTA